MTLTPDYWLRAVRKCASCNAIDLSRYTGRPIKECRAAMDKLKRRGFDVGYAARVALEGRVEELERLFRQLDKLV